MRLPISALMGLSLIFSAPFQTFAAEPSSASALMPKVAGSQESILVLRLSDGKTLFETNSEKVMIPASVTKIITSAALLHYFSPAFTFKTRFYAGGARQGDTIQGPLYIKGDGDPFVVNEKLWQLAADFKHMGIQHITGDVIIDNSLFDDEKRDSSREDSADASSHAYDAPVSCFGVNFNTLPIAIAPGRDLGTPGLVNFDPYPIADLEIKNTTKTGSGAKSSIQATRISRGPRTSMAVAGTVSSQESVTKLYRAMGDPVEESGKVLISFLNEAGIKVRGKVKEGTVPSTARLIYILESFDLGYIVRGLNHFSNNFIADMLVKRLGAAFPETGLALSPGSGTLSNGVKAIEKFLQNEVGIRDRFEIYNGSGLDHRNRFSAAQMVKVLSYMQSRMDLYPEFLASFPASGWSGTLENRFKGRKQKNLMEGVVRAKTGTLSQPVSVSSLAGYLGHPKHGALAFAILNNGQSASNQPSVMDFRRRQDQALLRLIEEY